MRPRATLLALLGWGVISAGAWSAESGASRELPPVHREENESVRHEALLAIEKGRAWLHARATPDGSWGNPRRPAVAAQALIALRTDPFALYRWDASSPPMVQARDFLLHSAREDGGLYRDGSPVCETALCVEALVAVGVALDHPVFRGGVSFLRTPQRRLAEAPEDGGFGDSEEQPGLEETCCAMNLLRGLEAPPDFASLRAFVVRSAPLEPDSGPLAFRPPCLWLIAASSIFPANDPQFLRMAHWVHDRAPVPVSGSAGSNRGLSVADLLLVVRARRAADEALIQFGSPAPPSPPKAHDPPLATPSPEPVWPRSCTLYLVTTQASSGAWERDSDAVTETALALQTLTFLLPSL